MSKLKILLDGTEIQELTLLKGREYSVGRSDKSDIVLNKSSVSRQHLKLIFDGEKWQIQVLSKFSTLNINGAETQTADLTVSTTFYVEGFEFRFIFEETAIKKEPNPNTYVPVAGSLLNPDVSHTNVPAHRDQDYDERTSVASSVGEPCLLIQNESTGEETLFTLEGNNWTVGRSSNCQIQINESKSSRNHFEVTRTTIGFEIVDLGSSNGTILNGKRIEPQVRVPLHVGDQVRVGQTLIEFQIRDPNFEAKLNEIPDHLLSDQTKIQMERLPVSSFPDFSSQFPQGGSSRNKNVVPYKPGGTASNLKKNQVKIAIAVLAVIIIYGATGEEEGELDQSSIPANAGKPDTGNLDKLSKEQKKFLEDTHKLAKSLYIQGKYDSALIEIKKIHAIVPFYGDSKEIELYSQQAVEIKLQQQEITDRTREAQAIKDKVSRIIEICETKYKPNTKTEQIQQCLAPALELDPENAQAQALLSKATKTEEERQQRERDKENLQARIRTGNGIYQNARNLEQAGKLLDTIAAYEKYINSGYPDPQGNKAKARQAVTQLRTKIKTDIQARLGMAEKFKSEEKYKDALKALARAIELDPAAGAARNMYDTINADLNRKLKSLYSDSVIEENLGNIEAAKQKWRLIKDQDIEGGNYFMKASRKLNRYEK